MKRFRKISTLFTAIVAMTLSPQSLWALPTGAGTEASPYLLVDQSDFDWLFTKAWDYYSIDSTFYVKVMADYTVPEGDDHDLSIMYGTWVFDFNGHTVNVQAVQNGGMYVYQNANVTIKDSSPEKSGYLKATIYGLVASDGSIVVVEGGTFEASIFGLWVKSECESVTLHGGNFISSGDYVFNIGNPSAIHMEGYHLEKPGTGEELTLSQTESCGTRAVSVVKDCVFENGICPDCGKYQMPVYNDTGCRYEIANAGQLLSFMSMASVATSTNAPLFDAALTADIVINDSVLNSDGSLNGTPAINWIMPLYFYGTFDGQGHTISGIYIKKHIDEDGDFSIDGLGFVKHLRGEIRNLGIVDSYFGCEGAYHTATFAAYMQDNGVLTDCYSFASIKGNYYCGGLAGEMDSNNLISKCYFAGKLFDNNSTVYVSPIVPEYYNNGSINLTYYLEDAAYANMSTNRVTSVSAEEMASGKVAFMLQDNRTDTIWGQQLTGTTPDAYPVFSAARVYASKILCDSITPSSDAVFANTAFENVTIAAHNDGTNPVVHHNATCTEGSYDEHTCSVCGAEYITNQQDDATGHIDENEDHLCDVCHLLTVVDSPILVTAENCDSLGLSTEYIGYKAIGTLSQLAGFAAEMGSSFSTTTSAPGPENAMVCAPRRIALLPDSVVKYVLTADIVVNANLLDEDGNLNALDEEGNLTDTLWLWQPIDFSGEDESAGPAVMSAPGNRAPSFLPVLPIQYIFDGNGHTISGLYQFEAELDEDDCGPVGFASNLNAISVIKNLGITDSYFGTGVGNTIYIGSIAAQSEGSIVNCWSDATLALYNGFCRSGGLVGIMGGGIIDSCSYTGTIINYGCQYFAGVVGYAEPYNNNIVISNTNFSGKVINTYSDYNSFSGIAEYVGTTPWGSLIIDKCYADGEITNSKMLYISGLIDDVAVGYMDLLVQNSYNSMKVNNQNGGQHCIAFIGSVFTNTYNDEDPSEDSGVRFCINYDATDAVMSYPFIGGAGSQYFNSFFNFYLGEDSESGVEPGGPQMPRRTVVGSNPYSPIATSEEEFASGLVAFYLNYINLMVSGNPGGGMQSPALRSIAAATEGPGSIEIPSVWYQAIDEDLHPVLKGDEYSVVYADTENQTFYNLLRTLENYLLADTAQYALEHKVLVDTLTYTRTFVDNDFNCLYLPFEAAAADFTDCSIYAINMFQQHDTNNNGAFDAEDELTLEVFKAPEEAILLPNHPYLIKYTGEDCGTEQNITFYDAVLVKPATKKFTCSSMNTDYTFVGTYKAIADTVATAGNFYTMVDDATLGVCLGKTENGIKPQRWYMTMTARESQFGIPAPVYDSPRIRIVVANEETNAIDEIQTSSTMNEGKFVESGSVVIVKNGKKYNVNGQFVK